MMLRYSGNAEHWVNQMLLLREIQSRTGGFTEFVPLGFIHDNTLLFAQGLARAGATLEEHLKVHALARILLAGSINHIQVSWVKLGREVSRVMLLAGADDYGGTFFEESISRLAGATAGSMSLPRNLSGAKLWNWGAFLRSATRCTRNTFTRWRTQPDPGEPDGGGWSKPEDVLHRGNP